MRLTEDEPLRGKVALVTGASRGLGAAVAVRLAEAGATVAVSARTLDETTTVPGSSRLPGTLMDTVAAIEDIGGRAFAIPADLSKHADRAQLVEAVMGRWTRVDLLVNNAAAAYFEPTSRMADSRIDLMLEVQLRAPIDLIRRVLPGMRSRRNGWILNVSSLAARHPDGPPYPDGAAGGGVYGACKAALERLTTAIAAEVYEDNVAVNALAPTHPDRSEEAETFAEAALALCGGVADFRSGHVTTSTAMLRSLGVET